MSDTVILAIIAGLIGLISPPLLVIIQRWASRGERLDKERREDEVAKQVRDAATQAQEAARLLVLADAARAKTAEVANNKLDIIHILVNSSMTAAMQSEYDAVRRELALMREVIDIKSAAGHAPTPGALAAIITTESKLTELRSALTDRKTQNTMADNEKARQ
jgi:hypothetical protein